MTTKRELIVQAVAAAVNGAGGATAHRSRDDALQTGELPAIVVNWTSEQPYDLSQAFSDKRLEVTVSVFAAGATPDTTLDAVIQAAHAAIFTNTTLAGLVMDVSESGTVYASEEAAETVVMLTATYVITYRHQRHNLGA